MDCLHHRHRASQESGGADAAQDSGCVRQEGIQLEDTTMVLNNMVRKDINNDLDFEANKVHRNNSICRWTWGRPWGQ